MFTCTSRFLILCLTLVAVALSVCSFTAAQENASSSDATMWYRDYANCFDRQNRPRIPQMRQFVVSLEAELARTYYNRRIDESGTLRFLIADAYTQIGNWDTAEKYNLELAAQASTLEQSQRVNQQLVGIYAMKRQWSRAVAYHVRWLANRYLYVVAPVLIVCLGWLALWQIGARERSQARLSRVTIGRLVMCACIPLYIALFKDV